MVSSEHYLYHNSMTNELCISMRKIKSRTFGTFLFFILGGAGSTLFCVCVVVLIFMQQ